MQQEPALCPDRIRFSRRRPQHRRRPVALVVGKDDIPPGAEAINEGVVRARGKLQSEGHASVLGRRLRRREETFTTSDSCGAAKFLQSPVEGLRIKRPAVITCPFGRVSGQNPTLPPEHPHRTSPPGSLPTPEPQGEPLHQASIPVGRILRALEIQELFRCLRPARPARPGSSGANGGAAQGLGGSGAGSEGGRAFGLWVDPCHEFGGDPPGRHGGVGKKRTSG